MSTVLVAYERSAVRTTISRLLIEAGYEVLVATPRAALAAARQHGAVQVVITDDAELLQGQVDAIGARPSDRPRLRVLYVSDLDEAATVRTRPSLTLV